MFQDRRIIAAADPRPASAVSAGAGGAGLAGLCAWIAVARGVGMDGPYAALVGLAACGVPMVGWSLLVDRVHARATTGIDWARPRPWRETLDVSLVKLAGLWATWAGIALIYATGRFYWTGQFVDFPFAMWCLGLAAPVLFVLSVPYVLWLDRYLVEPRDGAWQAGALLCGLGADRAAVGAHLRSWAVKAFFLPFMLAVVPGGFGELVRRPFAWGDPILLTGWLVTAMFVVDVAFATVGYVLTLRPLDSHIRSANPFAAAWTAALICYPPFTLMNPGGPLDYHPGTSDWVHWFSAHPLLWWPVGLCLVALTAVYAWATVAFGPRFSNLTNRGIVTHGPYAWSRHPAYLSKNLFWWLSIVPVLSLVSWVDAARATALLGAVSGVYWWRAKTEERHLRADPDYVAYWEWMERHGAVPRVWRVLFPSPAVAGEGGRAAGEVG